eukprot:SAG31_NODE_218_length_19934_cov_81.634837_16_plen_128_part_00
MLDAIGNKSCCLGIGAGVRQADPSLAGNVLLAPTGAGKTIGKVKQAKSAAVSTVAAHFERQIQKESEDAQRDDESLRPENRLLQTAAMSATAAAVAMEAAVAGKGRERQRQVLHAISFVESCPFGPF